MSCNIKIMSIDVEVKRQQCPPWATICPSKTHLKGQFQHDRFQPFIVNTDSNGNVPCKKKIRSISVSVKRQDCPMWASNCPSQKQLNSRFQEAFNFLDGTDRSRQLTKVSNKQELLKGEDLSDQMQDLNDPLVSQTFANLKFVLTLALEDTKDAHFSKVDTRFVIEKHGGEIVDIFDVTNGDNTFLLARFDCKTLRYLTALSLSIPCVNVKWIQDCINNNSLLDYEGYLLKAGCSTINPEITYEWKPLKGLLLRGKRVWVISISPGFVDIWSKIVANLGGSVAQTTPFTLEGQLECVTLKGQYDVAGSTVAILLSDASCDKSLVEKFEQNGGIAVNKDWMCEALISGQIPDATNSQLFLRAA